MYKFVKFSLMICFKLYVGTGDMVADVESTSDVELDIESTGY